VCLSPCLTLPSSPHQVERRTTLEQSLAAAEGRMAEAVAEAAAKASAGEVDEAQAAAAQWEAAAAAATAAAEAAEAAGASSVAEAREAAEKVRSHPSAPPHTRPHPPLRPAPRSPLSKTRASGETRSPQRTPPAKRNPLRVGGFRGGEWVVGIVSQALALAAELELQLAEATLAAKEMQEELTKELEAERLDKGRLANENTQVRVPIEPLV
jgi:hypothetical protein